MGARQSKRSVDITTTPKKEGLPAEGVVGDAAAPGDGKLEKIEETDAKPTTNGVAPHTDAATPEDQEKDKDEATEKEKEKEDAPKVEEPKVESPTTETPAEGAAEVTTPTEGTPASPTSATSPESKETKKKDKPKKKWSFRSISFGKKDKNKPVREDAPKNGDVAKETLAEGGEEAEAATSPAEDKSAVSSPTEKEESGESAVAAETTTGSSATESKAEDEKSSAVVAVAAVAVVAVSAAPAEEKKEEPSTPAPTPVPVEAKKVEEMDKQVVAEAVNGDNIVEVSPVQAVIEAPVEVISQSKQKKDTTTTTSTTTPTTTATTAPSIIERKTSEDIQSQFPSSPPPTPIDPSPLQQAQQVAASASALAEALKLPAEAANQADIIANASSCPPQKKPTPISATTTSPRPDDITTTSSPENHAPPSPTIPIIEKTSEISSSESHEQTGNNALTIPANTANIEALTDIKDKPEALETVKPTVDEISVEKIVETIESVEPRENDLVIQTEEGPIPVCDDIIEAKSATIVLAEKPVDEIKEENCRDSSAPNDVQSSEVLLTEKEVPIINEPIIDVESAENLEKEVPPPLPASPVPVPKATSQLLNFMSTQIEDSPVIDKIIEDVACPLPPPVVELETTTEIEEVTCPLPPPVAELQETKEMQETVDDSHSQTDTSFSLPPPEEISESRVENIIETSEDLPPAPQDCLEEEISCLSLDGANIRDTENTINSEISEVAVSPAASIPQIPTDTTLLTPPRSPSPNNNADRNLLDINDEERATIEALELEEEPSNTEFKTESVEHSLNSYNSELELKDRLAETLLQEDKTEKEEEEKDNDATTTVNGLLSNDIEDNDQSKIETPVENNVVANDIGTTENNDDAPKSPPPAVPAEIPANLGPAITEDVASVTKAIEEIDISEKAVAAAVNENIESANTNEIIADMNHHNNMKE